MLSPNVLYRLYFERVPNTIVNRQFRLPDRKFESNLLELYNNRKIIFSISTNVFGTRTKNELKNHHKRNDEHGGTTVWMTHTVYLGECV